MFEVSTYWVIGSICLWWRSALCFWRQFFLEIGCICCRHFMGRISPGSTSGSFKEKRVPSATEVNCFPLFRFSRRPPSRSFCCTVMCDSSSNAPLCRPIVAPVCTYCFNLSSTIGIFSSTQSVDLEAPSVAVARDFRPLHHSNPSPQPADPTELERRRALAVKAVEERLKRASSSSVESNIQDQDDRPPI